MGNERNADDGREKQTKQSVSFCPSRVQGLPDATEVAVYRDRLEVFAAGKWIPFPFAKMVDWPLLGWPRRLAAMLGWRPELLPIAWKDRCSQAPDGFFRFNTKPKLTVYVPDVITESGNYLWWHIQEIIREGGYIVWDAT
jgi:hypothetical protein